MIIPEKTITENPFVDNVLYYSKLIALNCTVKDEEEALAKETVESLKRRELLINSIEKNSVYEMYDSVPKEILEKYIKARSNLDIYAEDIDSLKAHMNSYNIHVREKILNNLSDLARYIYINHYDIMMGYFNEISEDWFESNEELYNKCKDSKATYKELFNNLPSETSSNIIKTYINNYDDSNLDEICSSLENFENYIINRDDPSINEEVLKINKAMRDVFSSHYEMMQTRRYVVDSTLLWTKYISNVNIYKKCKLGYATYKDLYNLFPKEDLEDTLNTIFGSDIVTDYDLLRGLTVLDEYINNYDINSNIHIPELNKKLTDKYIHNYNMYINSDIYMDCIIKNIDFYELYDYLPIETKKIIINSEIKEFTNIQSYSESKDLLNSYLNTLDKKTKQDLKTSITKDLQSWYPSNYKELNNYYRTLIGIPPLDENGEIMVDTLTHTWDNNTKQFINFGDKFISKLPEDLYPEIHWKQEIYKFDAYDIGILNQYGILEDWIIECGSDFNDPRYKYLKYLGDAKLDLYTCSKAMNFQLIGIPTIDDDEFKRKFMDAYVVNRDYVIRAVYSDSHKFQSDYYNKFIIIFILINTIMDCLTNIPDYIIDREVFDARCIKYLFESFGIPYYSEIPLKYQRAMLKNLNTLIKYKSSTRNMVDICSLFGFSDVKVFGYYLFKQKMVDINTGEYLFDENNNISYNLDLFYVKDKTGEIQDYNGIRYTKMLDYKKYDENKYLKTIAIVKTDKDGNNLYDKDGNIITESKKIINNNMDVYLLNELEDSSKEFIPLKDADYFKKIDADISSSELKFIKVPVNELLTEYKNDPDYIIPYDEIVTQDEGNTWNADENHDNLYNKLLNHEFNAVKTKYVSVETVTEMTELSFQVSYFYNMLFDNMYSEDGLTVKIPHLKIDHNFKFTDVVCYLFALMYLYNGLEDNIMYSPTQILYIKGYNFNEDLNTVLEDMNIFSQKHPMNITKSDYGYITYDDTEKENIFDINDRIAEDGYDYQKEFDGYTKNPETGEYEKTSNGYKMKAFNLDCNIDALDKWLNDNFQLSLDDFIVDDSDKSNIITLRNFFSLNNSFYQKNIFNSKTAILSPIKYNQDIKHAFDYSLYEKYTRTDINENNHEYVTENNYNMEVITNSSDIIYIMDYTKYINIGDNKYAIYYKYIRNNNNLNKENNIIYYKSVETENSQTKIREYKSIFDGNIAIKDKNNNYIFASDVYYIKSDGEYKEITNTDYPDYFSQAATNSGYSQILNFGEYYIKDENGNWVLDKEKCYIKVVQGGIVEYKPVDGDYSNETISEEKCYIKHSDGHFIKLTETDYYKKKESGDEYNGHIYTEEECYIIYNNDIDLSLIKEEYEDHIITTDNKKYYYDKSDNPRVYYELLSDYYNNNNYNIYDNDYYVYDGTKYIHYSNLINPNNCYYKNNNGEMILVINSLGVISDYNDNDVEKIKYILVLQNNNDYLKYSKWSRFYRKAKETLRQYVYNSDTDHITVLNKNDEYKNTQSMIVVLNKPLSSKEEIIVDEKYNPEKTDGVWDENDWYYTEGYSGEHSWYYKDPNSTDSDTESEEINTVSIGSGFYLEAADYLNNTKLIPDNDYYLAFDIETNFTGNIQITCEADNSIENTESNVYSVTQGEKLHITQVFTTNNIEQPSLKFLIYNYNDNPIEIGDFIIISNIRFIKSENKNYIPQDIPSYDRLQELYKTNEKIYKFLVGLMNDTSDIHTYNIYKKLYDALMTSKYNKEAFKIGENKYAKTYTDFLETRDAVLYEKLCYYRSLDPDAMHKQIADDIVEVAYAIDDCIDTYSYGYLYSYFPAVSASYIQQYIVKIINFFKSWKVHLLGINTVYKFDDQLENTVKILERNQERVRLDYIKNNVFTYGCVKINPLDAIDISGRAYIDIFPDLADPTHRFKDYYAIQDRVRIISTTADKLDHFYDSDGELQLILNDATTDVEIDSEGNLIIASEDNFAITNNNDIIMETDNDEQYVFGVQRIGEINSNSIDIINLKEEDANE